MTAPARTRPARSRWATAYILAIAALCCGLLLGGLSAWFLGAVAIAGLSAAALTFNFHIPGALVRLFAIGRTAAKYGERLAGHDAALTDQLRRRSDLFARMAHAPSVRRSGWQLGDQDRLADYLDDVEDLDNGRLRVDLPALAFAAGFLACLGATLVIMPLAAPQIALLVLLVVAAARHVALLGPETLDEVRRLRREGAQRFGAAASTVVCLQAEGAWSREIDASLARMAQAEDHMLALRRASSILDAVAAAFGPAAALIVMATAWMTGHRGEALLIPAFLAFSWLALAEVAQGLSRILVAGIRRRAAARAIEQLAQGEPGDAANSAHGGRPEPSQAGRLTSLDLAHLQRRAPDGRPIGAPLDARFESGRPTALVGPSGCGKTSLLKQIAGWIGDDLADIPAFALPASRRRELSVFCPHDAVILADTVRANLFAPGAQDGELRAALAAVELTGRIEAAGGLDAWITQDSLSLGEAQRLNLARMWLSRRPIVLLDEPTEHLDMEQGIRILHRLLDRLKDRIVVFSAHRATKEKAVFLRL